MVNQFFTVVSWHPNAEEWRVWRIRRKGKPRRKRKFEGESKQESIQQTTDSVSRSDLGVLTFIKSGETDTYYPNVSMWWKAAKSQIGLFGKKALVVKKERSGSWNVWESGPTKGYRSIRLHNRGSKSQAVEDAGILALEEDYAGVIVLNTQNEAHEVQPNMNVWGEIAEDRLAQDPAGSMLAVDPVGTDL